MRIAPLSAILLTLPAAALAEGRERFPGAEGLRIQDFTGTVEIIVGGSEVAATLIEGARRTPVTLMVQNGTLVVAGEPRPKNYKVQEEIDWRNNHERAFEVFLQSYPTLSITAPAGTDVDFERAIVMARAGDLKSDLRISGGYIDIVTGDLESANIGISGSGDAAVGRVAKALKVSIGGSGDFTALSAGAADFSIGGSGEIAVGPVSGDGRFSVNGSGDIVAASVGGGVDISVSGSGDISVGEAQGAARLSIAGSGDIAVGKVDGPTEVDIAGNGDIEIAEGRAENLRVSIAGSGDFAFGGTSTNLDVSMIGSGQVVVAKNEGTLRSTGRGGDVIVDGKRIGKH